VSRPRFIGLLLALTTLLVYLPATRDGFVIYDDGQYVTENRAVQNGLTWAGVEWAFTTGHASNWHPVTWLSHMLDCELFGLNAGAHHTVNVLFHAANTALLFVLLLRLTGAMWPAAFVAALFGWHPLHVESVAWVAERKDVLSTFFGLLTLLAYAGYARSRVEGRASRGRAEVRALAPRLWTLDYALALVCFGLGLMSKPMVVTLPFVMLLLDYWPLQRWSGVKGRESKDTAKPDTHHSSLATLILEKLPFFVLVAVSCIVTFQVQQHGAAIMTLEQRSLGVRFENALISYLEYLVKMIWPAHLAIFYPLPNHLSWIRAMAATAAALLGVISWIVWSRRRRYRWLLVGWLWYLGTLVPVIGLVQVGSAAMADRYTYFPLIGVFIAIAFGAREMISRFRSLKTPVAVAGGLALAGCVILTESQLRSWHDSESLFAHAIAVTGENPNALINYGVACELEGRWPEALAQYREAARLDPDNETAYFDLGNLLEKMGRPEEALPEQVKAVQLKPKLPDAHNTLGITLADLGRFDEAETQFQEAARLDLDYAWAPFEMGRMRLKQGRDHDALDEFNRALQIDPNNFQILAQTAHVLAADETPGVRDGRTACALATKANALTGGSQPYVLDVLGMAYAEAGDFDDAQRATRDALDVARAAQMKKIEPIQQRLELYQHHQPWHESFGATNLPPKEVPKN